MFKFQKKKCKKPLASCLLTLFLLFMTCFVTLNYHTISYAETDSGEDGEGNGGEGEGEGNEGEKNGIEYNIYYQVASCPNISVMNASKGDITYVKYNGADFKPEFDGELNYEKFVDFISNDTTYIKNQIVYLDIAVANFKGDYTEALKGCRRLNKVNIITDNFNPSSTGRMFEDCKQLTTFQINGVSKLIINGDNYMSGMFNGCINLALDTIILEVKDFAYILNDGSISFNNEKAKNIPNLLNDTSYSTRIHFVNYIEGTDKKDYKTFKEEVINLMSGALSEGYSDDFCSSINLNPKSETNGTIKVTLSGLPSNQTGYGAKVVECYRSRRFDSEEAYLNSDASHEDPYYFSEKDWGTKKLESQKQIEIAENGFYEIIMRTSDGVCSRQLFSITNIRETGSITNASVNNIPVDLNSSSYIDVEVGDILNLSMTYNGEPKAITWNVNNKNASITGLNTEPECTISADKLGEFYITLNLMNYTTANDVKTINVRVVEKLPEITKQPEITYGSDSSLTGSETETITIKAEATGSNLSWEWYEATAPNTTGTKISENEVLELKDVDASYDGRYYWAVIKNTQGTLYTEKVKLVLDPTPSPIEIISSVKSGEWTNQKVEFDFTGGTINGRESTILYNFKSADLMNEEWLTWDSSKLITFDKETNGTTLYVKAINNEKPELETEIKKFVIKIDQNVPYIEGSKFNEFTNRLEVSAKDELSGVAKYGLTQGTKNVQPSVWYASNILAVGTADTYTIWVKDAAGNVCSQPWQRPKDETSVVESSTPVQQQPTQQQTPTTQPVVQEPAPTTPVVTPTTEETFGTLEKSGVKKVKASKKKIKLKLKKISGAKYIVQYSLKSNMKNAKVIKTGKTDVTLKGLKSKKYYYIRVKCYTTINDQTIYSKWSGKKKVKVK